MIRFPRNTRAKNTPMPVKISESLQQSFLFYEKKMERGKTTASPTNVYAIAQLGVTCYVLCLAEFAQNGRGTAILQLAGVTKSSGSSATRASARGVLQSRQNKLRSVKHTSQCRCGERSSLCPHQGASTSRSLNIKPKINATLHNDSCILEGPCLTNSKTVSKLSIQAHWPVQAQENSSILFSRPYPC